MNIRIVKEARELRAPFLATLLLIVVPYVVWPHGADEFGYFAFGLGCALMGVSCFGGEFQQRTISLLLSQPVPRQVLWREKMTVLAAGMGVNLLAAWLCLGIFSHHEAMGWVLAGIALCLFCGGPAWTLQARQTIGGLAGALGFPASLILLGALLVAAGARWVSQTFFESPLFLTIGAGSLLVVYSAWAYRFGWSQFRELELLDTPSFERSLPGWLEKLLGRTLSGWSELFTGPVGCLVKKELRVQRMTFLGAACFCVLAIGGGLLHTWLPDWGAGIMAADYATYILLVPFVVGAMSVAEERAWGIAEWHLTLPPSAAQQWALKTLVTFATSVGSGVLLPWSGLMVTQALFGRPGEGAILWGLEFLIPILLFQTLLTSMAMFTASFSNSTLRAILWALGLVLGLGPCVWWGFIAGCWLKSGALPGGLAWFLRLLSEKGPQPQVWLVWFPAGLCLPICLLLSFAYSNYRHSGWPIRRFVLQAAAVLLVVACLGFLVAAYVATPMLNA